jgi:hypothetical protein
VEKNTAPKPRKGKIPGKHYAKQLPLGGVPQPKMGRPLTGNVSAYVWCGELQWEWWKEEAAALGMTPGQLLNAVATRIRDEPIAMVKVWLEGAS